MGLAIFSGRGKLIVWGSIQSPHLFTANFAFTFLNRKNNRFQTLLLYVIHIYIYISYLVSFARRPDIKRLLWRWLLYNYSHLPHFPTTKSPQQLHYSDIVFLHTCCYRNIIITLAVLRHVYNYNSGSFENQTKIIFNIIRVKPI